ncbi:condensation domain-containing protein [Gordonia soli]|uniref:Condensation domain-containing protein n=1 Tax=Gordonia soli NBRC 108243 TaxID=1223545 RepID=M0QPZ1_9ACTN|nr:condensation domain-containing protein [Gordonia soli]GAC70648.1 hypothetical protein GS4_38_00540 [Gordonia soli NBRC 108243]
MSILNDAQLEAMRRRLADAGIEVEPQTADTAQAAPEPVATDGRLGIPERRMWKIYQLDPESDAHNFAVHLEFGDTYSIQTVVASTQRLLASSQVLGSVIEVDDDGTPRRRAEQFDGRWVVPDRVWEWGVIRAEASATASVSDDRPIAEAVAEAAATLAKTPFRLAEEPAGRIRVIAHDGGVSLILVLHHLAGDETILPPVLRVLVSDGSDDGEVDWSGGTAVDAPANPAARTDAAIAHAKSTWAGSDIRYPLSGNLPDTTPEDSWFSVMGEGPGSRILAPIPDDRVARLVAFAREVGATPNALFVVLSALTVSALTDVDDFVLLVPADNRRPEETVDRVGYSGNIIPMRFTFDRTEQTDAAVRKAVSTVYEAMEYSSVDYGTILTALRNSGGRFPVAEVMTLVKNAPLRGVALPDGAHVTCEAIFKDVVHYPLSVSFEFDEHDQVHLEVEYRTDVLDDDYAARTVRVVEDLVAALPDSAQAGLGELLAQVGANQAV